MYNINIYIYIYIYTIYLVFTTEGFFELAIESLPEWDLNPRPLNSHITSECRYKFLTHRKRFRAWFSQMLNA